MSSLVEIRPIPIKDLDLYWYAVEPLLDKSLDYGFARYEWTTQGIREEIEKGEKALWIVFRDKMLIAAVVTSMRDHIYTGKRSCSIDFAGGSDFKDWDFFTNYMESVYKPLGCDIITIAGRLGWLRLHTGKGYKSIYHVIGKELNV